MIRFFILPAVAAAVILPATAQVAPPAAAGQAQPGETTIKTTTQEVVLDMVFRDKKGRPVKDIKPEEVQIFEEGAPQKLKSFQLVEGAASQAKPGAAAAPAAAPARPVIDPLREIRLITLIFQNLDNDGKRFFRAATKDLLEMSPEQNLFFSVYTVDQVLHCLQPFTANHSVFQKGVDRAVTFNSFTQLAATSSEIKQSLAKIVADPVSIPASSSGPPTQGATGAYVNYALAKVQYETLQFAESADRQAGDAATLFALQMLVRQQAKLPGRKVILYFNPWLRIPEAYKELFQDVISTANRSNVTFYTVDSKGLVTWSQASGGRDQLAWAANESRAQQEKGGVGAVTYGQAHQDDIISQGLRDNPLLWLKALADQTGGTAIAETNDYKGPLRLVMDEVRTYYEAAYTPQIDVLDGKFRKINVRVSRPDVVVHTRSGYFALPSLKGGQQLNAFEMPLLNALNATPAPADLPLRAAARRFNTRGPNVEYMLALEIPLKNIVFQTQPDNKSASARTLLMAVIKDAQGEIVSKFTKDFPVRIDAAQVEAAKAGNLVQTFRTELPPGRYTLAGVVVDTNGNKTAVNKSDFVVPAPSTKLTLSDLVIVRRNDALKDNQLLDAFYYEGGKIVPTLNDKLKGGPGQQLPFYFAVYPDPAAADAPQLTMSFYLDGQLLGSASAPLGKPEKTGRIPYIANIPADAFTPGKYEMRASIKQGAQTAEQSIQFTVE